MNPINSSGTGRSVLAAIAVFAVLTAACSSSEPLDIESLNLAVGTEIQAGATFEVAVPATEGVELSVVAAPPGVTAELTGAGEEMLLLRVAVDADTPRGAYNLALLAMRDGDRYELGWPFDVVDPGGAAPTNGPVATTQPGIVDALLVVDSPQVGDLFPSLSSITGRTSTELVGYRLLAGGQLLAHGSLDTPGGFFDVDLGFENTCCTEMLLEVFHLNDGGLLVSIPLNFPEPG
jgi:hypothetical protein